MAEFNKSRRRAARNLAGLFVGAFVTASPAARANYVKRTGEEAKDNPEEIATPLQIPLETADRERLEKAVDLRLAGSLDSEGVPNTCYTPCHSDCHSNCHTSCHSSCHGSCHGSRGWR